jgi:DNA (cytosine-5)-methyltransferase 1
MNGLAVCSGIGGLELGLKLVYPSLRTIAYVEREAYAAVILAARMEEGRLDKAPIWSDLATFDGLPWRGLVDIISSGFPCQPFSLAGKRKREKDERHLWPEIARIIEECEPSLIFLENVHTSAFREPFADLRAMGFAVAPPYICTAAEMGAGHLRRRVFVLAYRSCWGGKRGKGKHKGEETS